MKKGDVEDFAKTKHAGLPKRVKSGKPVGEELHGGQKKIDMNKNNKIDAHDFKLLRSKGTQKEEVKGVAEGFSDGVKGIKRSLKGKEHPDVVASKHAGLAMGHYNQGDIAAGDKETKRYVKTRDMHLKAKGVAEGTLKESGETYVWTAEFADGSTERLSMATDEVPYAKAAFEKKFPNKQLTKVDTDWKPVGGSYYSGMPTTAMPDRRPTEPRGRDVDNPMIREAWTLRGSKTRDNLEVKVYHDAERGRWALQMFVDGEYRPEETQHFDNAQDAKEALKVILNFGLKESPAMKDLSEAMAEIEEDMLSKVKNDLTRYLDKLEKKVKKEIGLSKKENGVKEDPTAVDTMTVPPPAPIQDPVMPESAPVKSIALEDGSVLEIHGDQLRGFEVRRGGRSLPTRFPNLDHAQMAVDLYQRRRQNRDDSADYVEER